MTTTDRPRDDRRQYPRMRIDADLTYTMNSDRAPHTGFCKNLSHTGILFMTENVHSPGEKITVMLGAAKGMLTSMKASVKIIRVQPSEDQYAVAGRIIEYH